MILAGACRRALLAALVLVLLGDGFSAESRAQSPPPVQDPVELWRAVGDLRAKGRFEEAIVILKGIFQEYGNAERVLRQAHNQMVFTQLARADTASAEMAAREALERFPDLYADIAEFPLSVNTLYDQLRSQMYGRLEVNVNRVEGALVMLDGVSQGPAPVQIPYLKPGQHTITIVKKGYKEHNGEIAIVAGVRNPYTVTLSPAGGFKKGWLPIAGAAVIGAVLMAVSGGDDAPGELPVLPEPPAPPQAPAPLPTP